MPAKTLNRYLMIFQSSFSSIRKLANVHASRNP
jgi:hypothetical protein